MHVLAAERNATMEDHILQSKKELYDAITKKIEEYDKGIRKAPERFYKKIAEKLQSVERKDIAEHTANARGRLTLTQKKIAAAKDADLKRIYKEYATLDAFECNLYQKKDFFLLSYWILQQWTMSDRITLENAEMDTMRLNKMIFNRGAELFEPPAGWTYKDAEAALEPLRKQGEAFDELLAQPLTSYALMKNGPVTNSLKEIGPKTKKAWKDPETGEGKIITSAGTKVTMNNFVQCGGMDLKTHKLLDMCVLAITPGITPPTSPQELLPEEARTVKITAKQYMDLTGLKDRKEAAKQLKEAAARLYNVSLKFDMEVSYPGKRKKEIEHWERRILEAKATWNRGEVALIFTQPLWHYFQSAALMPINKNIFRINGQYNPNSYFFANKLLSHHNMNITKPNANRISVSTLLNAPSIPSYEEVAKSDRHFDKRIISPFERDLDALTLPEYGILESWEYCNAKGEPLTDEQVDLKNYDVFSQLLINFKLKDYPDQTERIKKMQAAKKSHKTRAKTR